MKLINRNNLIEKLKQFIFENVEECNRKIKLYQDNADLINTLSKENIVVEYKTQENIIFDYKNELTNTLVENFGTTISADEIYNNYNGMFNITLMALADKCLDFAKQYKVDDDIIEFNFSILSSIKYHLKLINMYFELNLPIEDYDYHNSKLGEYTVFMNDGKFVLKKG